MKRPAPKLMNRLFPVINLLMVAGLSSRTHAQNLQLLSLRSRGGELTFLGDYERNATGITGSEDYRIFRRIATQRLNFAFDGSIIHPRFIRFGGSAGTILSQGGIHSNDLNFPTKGTDISYTLTGSLLPEHPVSLNYQANRGTTVVLTGQLQGYRVRQIRNNLSTNIGRGLPFNLRLGISESSRQPERENSFIEEERSQIDADLTLKPLGILKIFSIQFRRQLADRPFYDSRLITRILNSRQILDFSGSRSTGNNQLELRANIFDQSGTLPVRNDRFSVLGRWELPASFFLSAGWNYILQRTRGEKSHTRQVRAELNHQLYQSLKTQLSSRYQRQVTRLLKTGRRSGRLTTRYTKRTVLGRLEAGLNLENLYEDRDASGVYAAIIREELVLTGFEPVFLSRDQVIHETIAVYDSLGIVRFMEGDDYIIRTVGTMTGIERLATGRIADGDRVLVDYEYETGGAGEITSRTRGWNLGMTFGQGSRIYIRRRELKQDLLSGDIEVLLNPADSWIVGATLQLLGLVFRAEYEDQDSRISPYLKREASLGTRIQVEQHTDFGFNIRRLLLNNILSPYGSDLWGGQLTWGSIPISRIRLQGSLMYEVDTGSDLDRRRSLAEIRAATRYGQTTLSLTFQYGQDRYGPNNRIRSLGRFELIRSF